MARETHLSRPLVEELRELRNIASREHGPQARSTRQIQQTLAEEEERLRKAPQRDRDRPGRSNR